jgi:uncharacterized membrane protein YozB (DUF420 family)
MKVTTIYDLNFVLQLTIFAFFLAGIYYIKRGQKSLGKHRLLMGIAVFLNAILILLIMGRSFFASIDFLAKSPYGFGSLITWTHAFVGGCAEILGASFLRRHTQNVRFRMRAAAMLWTVALLLGIVFYTYVYLL